MPNKSRQARALVRPAPDLKERQIPATRQPARAWFRLHRSTASAVSFGLHPFHRFSHATAPYPVLYLGPNISTCLWEVFGDDVFQDNRVIAASKWRERSVSRITVPELKVCAVSLEKTRDVMGVDKASLLAVDLTVPQEWGLAVQEHPTSFQAIKYTSRFVDQPCLALFDRGDLSAQLKVNLLGSLDELDPAIDWLHERKAALV
jgi:hypothetical protein